MKHYSLSNEIISQIAKLIQLAILTGTDVTDNLRTLRVQLPDSDEGSLILTPEYRALGESQVSKLLEKVEKLSKSTN